MRAFHRRILLCLLLCFVNDVRGLKCRTNTDAQQNNDFEYVVRMCLRHLRNESDMYDLYRLQNDYDYNSNKRNRDDMSGDNNNNNNNNNNNKNNNNNNERNHYNRNRGYPEGFDRFWPPGGSHDRWLNFRLPRAHQQNPNRNVYCRDRFGDDGKYGQEGDYTEFDFFGAPRNGKDGRKKYRGRPQVPHSYQQQLQHDREMYGRGNRDSGGHFSTYNRNKNTKLMFNKDRDNDSPLADIDPCVIHCIFQEMQMVDDNGKPNKGLISQKMTQKIRNPELKNFIQESVDECFDAIDDNDFDSNRNANGNSNNNNNNNRYRRQEVTCDWAKNFAICLEDKGRENCDDWNEPIQKNHSNSKTNEDQRHKSKQTDRG